jgi:hypothetical protein
VPDRNQRQKEHAKIGSRKTAQPKNPAPRSITERPRAAALVSVIGMGTVQHHQDDCYSADSTEYHTNAKVAASGERLNNERRPKRVTVKTNRSEEKDNPKVPNRRVRQRCKDAIGSAPSREFARPQVCSPTNLFLPN